MAEQKLRREGEWRARERSFIGRILDLGELDDRTKLCRTKLCRTEAL